MHSALPCICGVYNHHCRWEMVSKGHKIALESTVMAPNHLVDNKGPCYVTAFKHGGNCTRIDCAKHRFSCRFRLPHSIALSNRALFDFYIHVRNCGHDNRGWNGLNSEKMLPVQ